MNIGPVVREIDVVPQEVPMTPVAPAEPAPAQPQEVPELVPNG